MARAGFYAVESRTIRFGRDGHWYSDDERIENPRIADLFSRSVHPAPDGGYELRIGDERASIEVDDTPWVVRRIDGNPEEGFRISLNDGTDETLDPATLSIGGDHSMYCLVKDRFPARFLRPAYYELARWIDLDGGKPRLRLPDGSRPIPKR